MTLTKILSDIATEQRQLDGSVSQRHLCPQQLQSLRHAGWIKQGYTEDASLRIVCCAVSLYLTIYTKASTHFQDSEALERPISSCPAYSNQSNYFCRACNRSRPLTTACRGLMHLR